MINYRNKVQLIGEVSAIQVYETPKGILYCNFKLATNETTTNLDEVMSNKDIYHSCIAFKKQAAFIRDLIHNGNVIALEGRLIHMESKKGFNKCMETLVEVSEIIKLH